MDGPLESGTGCRVQVTRCADVSSAADGKREGRAAVAHGCPSAAVRSSWRVRRSWPSSWRRHGTGRSSAHRPLCSCARRCARLLRRWWSRAPRPVATRCRLAWRSSAISCANRSKPTRSRSARSCARPRLAAHSLWVCSLLSSLLRLYFYSSSTLWSRHQALRMLPLAGCCA